MRTTPGAYTYDEMMRLTVDALPTRGPVCPKCGVCIPQFADLTEKDEARLRKLICEDRKMMAMHELKSLTRCRVAWAKICVASLSCSFVLDSISYTIETANKMANRLGVQEEFGGVREKCLTSP